MWEYLPTDLLSDILSRLQVKTLLRCTSVWKSWYTLISPPCFITTHLNRNKKSSNGNNQILVRNQVGNNCYCGTEYYSLYRDNETFDKLASLDLPFTCIDGCFRVISCSNGLVFFSDDEFGYKETMYLWNPSIRKFVTVPRPTVTFDSHGPFDHGIGFGFNTSANDYKIVRLVCLKSNDTGVPPKVELYELSTGSWRSINAGDFNYFVDAFYPHAFLNGVVHWIGNEKRGYPPSPRLVVLFDMKNEELGAMMLPPNIPWFSQLHVAVLRDLLSLIQENKSTDHRCIIWVMKDYGVAKSWTKEFTIDLESGFLNTPFGFRENGSVLLSAENLEYGGYAIQDLVSYDPKSKQIKNLGVHGRPSLFYKDSYVESLVLIKGLSEVLERKENTCDAVAFRQPFLKKKTMKGNLGNNRMKKIMPNEES